MGVSCTSWVTLLRQELCHAEVTAISDASLKVRYGDCVQTRLEKRISENPGNKIKLPKYYPEDKEAILLLEINYTAVQGNPFQLIHSQHPSYN